MSLKKRIVTIIFKNMDAFISLASVSLPNVLASNHRIIVVGGGIAGSRVPAYSLD